MFLVVVFLLSVVLHFESFYVGEFFLEREHTCAGVPHFAWFCLIVWDPNLILILDCGFRAFTDNPGASLTMRYEMNDKLILHNLNNFL